MSSQTSCRLSCEPHFRVASLCQTSISLFPFRFPFQLFPVSNLPVFALSEKYSLSCVFQRLPIFELMLCVVQSCGQLRASQFLIFYRLPDGKICCFQFLHSLGVLHHCFMDPCITATWTLQLFLLQTKAVLGVSCGVQHFLNPACI